MHDLSITYHPPSSLTANPRNARTHDRRQIRQIADSIRAFGFTNPVLVDEHNELIAGHGRLAAADKIGLELVPAIVLAHLTSDQKRALMLADNKIALNAGWDMELLAAELADLSAMEIGFDVDLTGFEVGEIDIILGVQEESTAKFAETVELPTNDSIPITQPGDLWQLGAHRVLCGDARLRSDMKRLMEGEKADAGFTDPPYNVPINGHVSGKGAVQHREFEVASGEMSQAEFTDFLTATLGLASEFSRDGAVWFACMDWRHLREMLSAGGACFDTLLNLCVWAKTNGGMGSLYRSQHELVFVFRKGTAHHRNNVQLGRYGRNRTNVWTYPGVNTFRAGRMEELAFERKAAYHILPQLAILAACGMLASAAIIIRVMPKSSPVKINAGAILVAALVSLPVAAIEIPVEAIPPRTVIGLLGVGIISTAIGQLLRVILIRRRGPIFLTPVGYLAAMVGAIMGITLLGEKLTMGAMIAFVVILAGLIIAQDGTGRMSRL
jgi:hypothetical protein